MNLSMMTLFVMGYYKPQKVLVLCILVMHQHNGKIQ